MGRTVRTQGQSVVGRNWVVWSTNTRSFGARWKAGFSSFEKRKVLLDSDLAELYRVTVKRLNQQVKRNAERFPEDLCFA